MPPLEILVAQFCTVLAPASSLTTWLLPLVKVGASLTALTLTAIVSSSGRAPPLPVPFWSLVLIMMEVSPLKFLVGLNAKLFNVVLMLVSVPVKVTLPVLFPWIFNAAFGVTRRAPFADVNLTCKGLVPASISLMVITLLPEKTSGVSSFTICRSVGTLFSGASLTGLTVITKVWDAEVLVPSPSSSTTTVTSAFPKASFANL